MISSHSLGQHSVSGLSLGGVYTSLYVPELDSIFDAGIAPRSFVGAKNLFLSHGHADHIGALPAMIGARGLAHLPAPRVFLPREILDQTKRGVDAFNQGQHRKLEVQYVGLSPGDEVLVSADLYARAFRTLHSVPSLGFELFRRVKKLRPVFQSLPPQEIADRRRAGDDLFDDIERSELVYATDTLIDVLDQNPHLYETKSLILECTFLDDRKSTEDARLKSHVHLDEIIARADRFNNQHLALMHFSQVYSPQMVRQILKQRLAERLKPQVVAIAPRNGPWPG